MFNKALETGAGAAAPAMTVETTVTSTGSRDGEELVQDYVQLRGTPTWPGRRER